MKHFSIILAVVLAIFTSPPCSHAACTISVPDVVDTGSAVSATNFVTSSAYVNVYVTCSSGQPWSLYMNLGALYPKISLGATGGMWWLCGSNKALGTDCSSNYASNGLIMTGTGTNSPQLAAQLASSVRGGSWNSTYNRYASSAGTFGPIAAPSTWFKLVGDTTVYAGMNVSSVVTQSCEIASLTNMTMAYTGSARVDGSLSVSYICGGSTVPAIMRVGPGNHANGEVRRAEKNGGYIAYRLYWDAARTFEIGALTNNSTNLPTSPTYGNKTIYSSILQNDPGYTSTNGNGAYTDSTTVYIEF